MKSGFRLLCGFLALGASTGLALADDIASTVTAGKRTLVGQFALYSLDTCYAGPVPDVRIVNQPAHGKLEFAVEQVAANAGNCGKMNIHFRRVYYTPSKGFRGQDTAAVDFVYSWSTGTPRMTTRRHSYQITVK